MTNENLKEYLLLFKSIPSIYKAHKELYSNDFNKFTNDKEFAISFGVEVNGEYVYSKYDEGSVCITVSTRDCIVLATEYCFEATQFDDESEICYSRADDAVYIKIFDYELHSIESCYNQKTKQFSFDDGLDEHKYSVGDIDEAEALYFSLSTIYDGLIKKEYFMNQFIAFFELQKIMKNIPIDYSVKINSNQTPDSYKYSDCMKLKFPKVSIE